MTMRTIALAAVLALAIPVGAGAQIGMEEGARPQRPRAAPSPEMREQMRERVEARFLEVAGERLDLTEAQRTRLGEVMRQNADARRDIAEQGMRLRREAADLLRAGTPDAARAEGVLNELTRLRERELQLWRSEQQALAGVLTPAQRLELMAMRARFDERVRDVRRDREAPRPPGAGFRRDGPRGGRPPAGASPAPGAP